MSDSNQDPPTSFKAPHPALLDDDDLSLAFVQHDSCQSFRHRLSEPIAWVDGVKWVKMGGSGKMGQPLNFALEYILEEFLCTK